MSGRRFTATDAALLMDVMRHRRDSRGNDFTSQPISDTEIDNLIDAALLGPSVGFSQPWEFVVIRDDNIKRQVQKIFRQTRAGPDGDARDGTIQRCLCDSKYVADGVRDEYRHGLGEHTRCG